uniref:Ribonuclease A-domain domain-containing protein n=1 Tax=Sander lucioperca TaxID=283035 RepID=A0A8D0D6D5_SANLU
INMKISIFAGVLLISAALISVKRVQQQRKESAVEKFERQHIKVDMNNNGCTEAMRNKRFKEKNGNCNDGRNIGGNYYKSNKNTFNVVVCSGANGKYPCVSNSSAINNVYIVTECDGNREPVHFSNLLLPDGSE